MNRLKEKGSLEGSSSLTSFTPFLDEFGLIRIDGRQQNLEKQYGKVHPVILHGKHLITKLVIRAEHIRLLHAGPTLLHASLSRRIHVIGGRRSIRSVTRQCVTCRKISARPLEQRMGSLRIEHISADHLFNRVGIDFARPFYTKYSYVRKPIVVTTYVCLYISLAVKAVHLEPVSDLTTNAFLACFRRFIGRRGKPSLVMSDNGTNFVGAAEVLKEMYDFLKLQDTQQTISRHYCSSHGITWKFIPERVPHFGGLWEAAIKSMKYHLRRVVGDTKLTFEELSTVLVEIEACTNSRPLTPVSTTEDSIEVLTPGHFLIGQPLEAIPHPLNTTECNSHLTRWHLTQYLVQHFW
jgi:hypothetical protein